jgi:hypothetical protein
MSSNSLTEGQSKLVLHVCADDSCPICLVEFRNKFVSILPCGHAMHYACEEVYYRSDSLPVCPICRTSYTRRVVRIQTLQYKWCLRLSFLLRIASLMRGFVSKLLKCAKMVARTLSDTVRVLLSNPYAFFVLLLHITLLFILDTILLYIFVRTCIRSSEDLGHALLCDGGWTLGVLCGLYAINRYALSSTTITRR